jgi:type I restriction enzyme M protein
MQQEQHTRLVNFIWNIADDVLRDLYVRSKYRDVILPVTVLRRLDAVLEPTNDTVLSMKTALDKAQIENQDQPSRGAAEEAQPRAIFANLFLVRGIEDAMRSGGTWR